MGKPVSTFGAQHGASTEDGQPVGDRLRQIRLERGGTLAAVASATGLSVSFLSQVERGTTTPSLASLRSIAQALGHTLSSVFATESKTRLLRKGERRYVIHPKGLWRETNLTPSFRRFQVTHAKLEPSGGTGPEPLSYESEEVFVVVLKGTFRVVEIESRATYDLRSGDVLVLDGRVPHESYNPGSTPAEVLWVASPPSY